MKKTLIALAVLAASGASFAQVSITGNYTAGYRASSASNADSSGLGIDTSLVTFTAKEDLGGGLSASAFMNIDGLNRGGIAGGDSGMALAGSFGKLALETGRGGDYLSGGTAGVGGVGLDGKVFSTLTAADSIAYTTPSFGGVTLTFSHDEGAIDQSGATGETTGNPVGLGAGAAGTPSGAKYQRGTGVTVGYAAGPLAVNANYKVWDQSGIVDNNSKNRISIRGSYDLGVAKVGAGFRNTQFVTGTRQDTFLAVGFAATSQLQLGADWGQRTQADRAVASADNGTRGGWGLKAEYSLSKRTSVVASYASWEPTVGAANRSTETNLLLSHSF